MMANRASFLGGLELQTTLDVMRPFSELILLVIPEPSQHYAPCPLQCCLNQRHWLGKNWALTAQGSLWSFGDVHKYTWYYIKLDIFFWMNRLTVSGMMSQLSASSVTQKLMINEMRKI